MLLLPGLEHPHGRVRVLLLLVRANAATGRGGRVLAFGSLGGLLLLLLLRRLLVLLLAG